MKAKLLTICLVLFSLPAMANLEIGAIAQSSRSWFNSDVDGADYGKSDNFKIGGLLLLPLFPGLSFRTGAIYHTRKVTVGGTYGNEVTDKLLEVPLNLQVGLPITDLYVFGGVNLHIPQSTECKASGGATCTIEKTKNDTATTLGVGYDLISFALFRLAVEAEYQMGNNDISPTDGKLKQSNFNLGAGFFFGF